MRLLKTTITCLPKITAAYRLSQGAFNPRAFSINILKGLCFLSLTSVLQSFMLSLWSKSKTATLNITMRTAGFQGTIQTHVARKSHMDSRLPTSIFARNPGFALLMRRAGHNFLLEVDVKGR